MKIVGPESLEGMRLRSLYGRLKLETLGMRFRGRSASATVREKFEIKARRKLDVLREFEEIMRHKGLVRT